MRCSTPFGIRTTRKAAWSLLTLLTTVASALRLATPVRAHQVPPLTLIGLASWYGDELAGHPTASGERFDPRAATCAHRWLPFGTWLRIQRADHRRLRTWARISDRGPWVPGRVLDLSRRVMEQLGGIEQGVIPVIATIVDQPPWPWCSEEGQGYGQSNDQARAT